jgi:hypothetical protein
MGGIPRTLRTPQGLDRHTRTSLWQPSGAASIGALPSGRSQVWAKLHRLTLDEFGAGGELDWSRCAIDSVNMPALKGGA